MCEENNYSNSQISTNTVVINNGAEKDFIYCTNCGNKVNPKAFACPNCGFKIFDGSKIALNANGTEFNDTAAVYGKLAEYEEYSGIVWMAIGVIQCLSLVGIICGIWNIVVATQRLKYSKDIKNGTATNIYDTFEKDKSSIITMLILNIVLGAVIGIIGAIFDLHIRDFVMKNETVFKAETEFAPVSKSEMPNELDIVAEIKKYKELLDIDAITEEEFEIKKRELLNI